MKRLFAFVLAICMLTTAFAGCGQQTNTPTEPKADQASTNEVEKKDEKPAKDPCKCLAIFRYDNDYLFGGAPVNSFRIC